jgi:hypothetical protein
MVKYFAVRLTQVTTAAVERFPVLQNVQKVFSFMQWVKEN